MWRSGVPNPEELIAVPFSLYEGDAARARDIYAGCFELAGETIETNGQSPFSIDAASPLWIAQLHGFTWLRHLQSADSPISRTNAQALVSDWIASTGKQQTGIAWQVEIIAERVLSWLGHAVLIVDNFDQEFYASFLHSIAEQTRHLIVKAETAQEGLPRLKARVAIATSSLCLAGQNEATQKKHIYSATEALGRELEGQFLADGGHISRNPDAGIVALAMLYPLRDLYLRCSEAPPVQLVATLDRVRPMVDYFLHRDGTVAHFNGGGRLEPELLARVLAIDKDSGNPPENATLSGYQRLRAGGVTIIIDTGKAHSRQASGTVNAGCLSFEMSSGLSRIIVNCGAPDPVFDRLYLLARSSAAHSTAVLNDTSSCRFEKYAVGIRGEKARISDGINQVSVVRRSVAAGEQVRAFHDGYQTLFGLLHERTVFLADDGSSIHGTDRFVEPDGVTGANQRSDCIALRFHLHPDVTAVKNEDNISISISSSGGEEWKFSCVDARIDLEDSIYFSPSQMPSQQIVVYAMVANCNEIRWIFEQIATASTEEALGQNSHSTEPPDDLLDLMTRKPLDKTE